MNISHIVKAGLLTVALSGMAAHATFVNTDWLNQGDQKVSLDTDTGIEWLKTVPRNGESFAQTIALLNTTYAGWRLPTEDEVHTMMLNTFDTPAKYSNFNPTNTNGYNWLASVLGYANNGNFTFSGAAEVGGYYQDDAGFIRIAEHWNGGIYYGTQAVSVNYAHGAMAPFLVSDGGLTFSSLEDPTINSNNPNAPINQAVEDVNAPFAFGLLGLGLLSFAGLRRRIRPGG
jgi:hypothetical protein